MKARYSHLRLDSFLDCPYSISMFKRHTPVNADEVARQGATLRTLRELNRLTVDQLANELGISASHLYNIEAGRKGLTEVMASKAAQALAVPRLALVRDGFFDREAAEEALEVQRLKDRVVALVDENGRRAEENARQREELERLRRALDSIQLPKVVA